MHAASTQADRALAHRFETLSLASVYGETDCTQKATLKKRNTSTLQAHIAHWVDLCAKEPSSKFVIWGRWESATTVLYNYAC